MHLDPSRYWPSEANTLLVTAALHPDPDRARRAWRDWEDLQRFESATWAELRVFPIVARRLPALGLDSPLLPRLAGVRRFLWTKARMMHRAVTPFLSSLRDAGITPVLTKGAGRVALDPREAVDRYSHDVDVLVRPGEWKTAVDLLLAADYAPEPKLARNTILRMRQRYHGLGFVKAEARVDLHLFAMMRNRCEGDDDGLRARSMQAHFGGIPVRVPSAEDRVVIAVGHGLLVSPGGVSDWAFDAVAALATPGFDWTLVQRELIRRGLSAFGVAALGYLRNMLAQPVPAEVLAALARDVDPVFIEELEVLHNSFVSRSPHEHTVFCLADLERARRASADLPPGELAAPRETDWAEATILPAAGKRAETASLTAPDWPGRLQRLDLEVAFPVEAPRGRRRLLTELICFEHHESRLHQRIAPVENGQVAITFTIPGDFFFLRQPTDFQLRAWHLSADRGCKTTPIPSLRYRWRGI